MAERTRDLSHSYSGSVVLSAACKANFMQEDTNHMVDDSDYEAGESNCQSV